MVIFVIAVIFRTGQHVAFIRLSALLLSEVNHI